MFTLEHANYNEMKRLVFISAKIIVGLLILICFGTSLVTCNENIPFCKEQLQRLKQDVEVWNERCWNNTDQGNSTPCCQAEKEYNQERMKMHVEMCFHSGQRFIMGRKLRFRVFITHFVVSGLMRSV